MFQWRTYKARNAGGGGGGEEKMFLLLSWFSLLLKQMLYENEIHLQQQISSVLYIVGVLLVNFVVRLL